MPLVELAISRAPQPTIYLDEDCVVSAENADELMACGDTSIGLTYEECIVQAENAAEIADCGSPPPVDLKVDMECIVQAENAEEIRACNDNTLGITVEECIVQAESAEEIADCKSD